MVSIALSMAPKKIIWRPVFYLSKVANVLTIVVVLITADYLTRMYLKPKRSPLSNTSIALA